LEKVLHSFYHMKDHIQLLIPPGVKDSLLLSKGLSIIDFLQFPLPGIAAAARESTQSTAGQPKYFFSTLFPTITEPESIQKIPLPPLPILKQLSQDIDLTSTRSIICQHAPSVAGHRFPVWILTYWTEVAQIWPRWDKKIDQPSLRFSRMHSVGREYQRLSRNSSNRMSARTWTCEEWTRRWDSHFQYFPHYTPSQSLSRSKPRWTLFHRKA